MRGSLVSLFRSYSWVDAPDSTPQPADAGGPGAPLRWGAGSSVPAEPRRRGWAWLSFPEPAGARSSAPSERRCLEGLNGSQQARSEQGAERPAGRIRRQEGGGGGGDGSGLSGAEDRLASVAVGGGENLGHHARDRPRHVGALPVDHSAAEANGDSICSRVSSKRRPGPFAGWTTIRLITRPMSWRW